MDEEITVSREGTVAALREERAMPGVVTAHGLGELPDTLQAVAGPRPQQLSACKGGNRSGLGRVVKQRRGSNWTKLPPITEKQQVEATKWAKCLVWTFLVRARFCAACCTLAANSRSSSADTILISSIRIQRKFWHGKKRVPMSG